MKGSPSTIRRQIMLAFLACFIFMAILIGSSFRMLYLVVFILLLGFMVFFVRGKVVRPLGRLARESELIASGVFQDPLAPLKDTENEIFSMITALKQMMNELQRRQDLLSQSHKNTTIGTLTAGISHELNNPLNNIILTLETLIEDNRVLQPEERLQLYREAVDQAERAGGMVNNLLEFSRANRPGVEEVNLEVLIDQTTQLLHNELKRRRIKVFKDIRETLPLLNLNRNGLQQVLVNLFLNSIQAMPNGGLLRIKISPGKKEVNIEIADNGMGIPSEYLDRIFNPFFTTKKEGTGLGLWISRDFLQKQGGRLEVRSVEGQGSIFSLVLPYKNPIAQIA